MLVFIVSIASVLLVSSLACNAPDGHTCMTVYNKCPFPIWPGVQGKGPRIANGGFYLGAGESRELHVPFGWKSARIWARTGCDGNYRCETGGCGNKLECEGRGGVPPASLAEFTLNGYGGQDFYDVSMVDGYNLPLLILPVEGTYRTNGRHNDCKMAGGCVQNLADANLCPPDLQVWKNGRVVACKSACLAYHSDEACCRGYYNHHGRCNNAPGTKPLRDLFKNACPGAYSFAYDDAPSTFFCRGVNGRPSPDYVVQFC